LQYLTNPIWNGKIVFDNPVTEGGAGLTLAEVEPAMGNATWTSIMTGIAANHPTITSSGSAAYTFVSSGQDAIGFAHYDDYLSGLAKGAPVKWVFFNPMPVAFTAIAMTKDAPEPAMAELFIEFVLSVTGQQTYVANSYFPVAPVVLQAHNIIPANVTLLTSNQVANNLSQFATAFSKIFANELPG
jgi:ABC-type Fe3+ transport system substrate-binding protein